MSDNQRPDPTLVESLLEEGLFLFGADKTEAAISVWEKVLEISPNDPRALDYLRSAGASLDKPRQNPRGSGKFAAVYVEAPPEPPRAFEPRVTPASISQPELPTLTEPTQPVVRAEPAPMAYAEANRPNRTVLFALLGAAAIALVGMFLFGVALLEKRAENAAAPPTAITQSAPQAATSATLPAGAPAAVAPSETHFRVELSVEPANATIELDGETLEASALVKRLPLDGTRHELVVSAEGYESQRVVFVDAAPPRLIRLTEVSKLKERRQKTSRERSKRTRRAKAKAPRVKVVDVAPVEKKAPKKQRPPTDNRDPWN